MLPDVISPGYFKLDGREKCFRCNSRGQMPATNTVHVDWPTFQPNPKNKLWHVEQDDKILESGVGLRP